MTHDGGVGRAGELGWWRTITRPPWRDPLNAGTFLVFGLLYYLTDLHTVLWTDDRAVPLAAQLAMLAVGVVAVLNRARHPLIALPVGLSLVGVAVATGTSLPIILIFCDVLYAFVLYGPRRAARVATVAVGVIGIGVVITLFVLGDWRLAVLGAAGVVAVPLIPVWWGMQVRFNREVAAAERVRADQLARIAELDRQAAVAAERSRMARDLHDVVAGHLSAIAIQSEAVLAMADTGAARGSTIDTVLRSIRENSVQALTEMRAMIGLLRGNDSDPRTAPPRLRELEPLVESARAGGVDVHLDGDLDALPDLPAAVDLAAYRIAQEAMTNVVKHASGATARLLVRCVDGRVVVEISNELPDEQPSAKDTGIGVANMHDRAEAVGGTLTAGVEGHRWRVRAVLPIGAQNPL